MSDHYESTVDLLIEKDVLQNCLDMSTGSEEVSYHMRESETLLTMRTCAIQTLCL